MEIPAEGEPIVAVYAHVDTFWVKITANVPCPILVAELTSRPRTRVPSFFTTARYFGAAAGNAQADSAWNAGAWHMIALNGESGSVGGCDAASPQGQFLRAHLGSTKCTLAYWHEPYYNSTGPVSDYRYFWQTLYAAGADIVLNGHIHTYARFAPQDADGNVNAARGIRQFIVGTGGKSQGSLPGSTNVEFTASGFGVLKLRLHATSYDWRLVAVDGSVVDSGSAPCH